MYFRCASMTNSPKVYNSEKQYYYFCEIEYGKERSKTSPCINPKIKTANYSDMADKKPSC